MYVGFAQRSAQLPAIAAARHPSWIAKANVSAQADALADALTRGSKGSKSAANPAMAARSKVRDSSSVHIRQALLTLRMLCGSDTYVIITSQTQSRKTTAADWIVRDLLAK
jgi:hypothetical protein